MPRVKDPVLYAERAKAQVIEAYILTRDEYRAKTRLKDRLSFETDLLKLRLDGLEDAAHALGVSSDELDVPESSTNEAKVVLTK